MAASFVSNQLMYPFDESSLLGAPAAGVAVVVPGIEIDAPLNGAGVPPRVRASTPPGRAATTRKSGSGVSGCTGTVANGARIDTSPGTHTFTVSGRVSNNGNHAASATVTYTVKSRTQIAHASLAGVKFTLSVPSACVAPHRKLPVTLSKSGAGKGYRLYSLSYNLRHGKPALVTSRVGTVHIPLGALKAGTHTLKLVITLASTKSHGRSKTKTLTLPFSIC